MPCSNCGVKVPEQTDTWNTDDPNEKPIPVYWFAVNDGPVEMGVEPSGEIGFRFRALESLEHPEPEEGQQILCGDCFESLFPLEDETDDTEGPQDGAGGAG